MYTRDSLLPTLLTYSVTLAPFNCLFPPQQDRPGVAATSPYPIEVIVIIGGVVNAANGSVARSFKKSPASVFDRPTVLAGKESQRS